MAPDMNPGLAAGFADPVHDAQTVFRAVLGAMAEPGLPQPVAGLAEAPAPLSPVMAAVALTLLDQEVAYWLCGHLAREPVRAHLAFHTGARRAARPQLAEFVLALRPEDLPPLEQLAPGTPDYPDRSATVLVGPGDDPGARVRLSGPGIEAVHEVQVPGFGRGFWEATRANHARYPLGIDQVLCLDGAVIGLPRSTRIDIVSEA